MRAEATELKGFIKGLNREADPFLLEEGEVPDSYNVLFGKRGEAKRRNGYTRLDYPLDIDEPIVRIFDWSHQDEDTGITYTYLIAIPNGVEHELWVGTLIGEAT